MSLVVARVDDSLIYCQLAGAELDKLGNALRAPELMDWLNDGDPAEWTFDRDTGVEVDERFEFVVSYLVFPGA